MNFRLTKFKIIVFVVILAIELLLTFLPVSYNSCRYPLGVDCENIVSIIAFYLILLVTPILSYIILSLGEKK